MAFVTDAVTLQDLSDAFSLAGVSSFASQMPNINLRCHALAYSCIVTAFTKRGYTAAQIAAWDVALAGPVERDLTTFFAFSLAFIRTEVRAETLKVYDRREDLKVMPIITNGAFVDPAGTRGVVTQGVMQSGDDIFVWPDPADPLLGEVTRW